MSRAYTSSREYAIGRSHVGSRDLAVGRAYVDGGSSALDFIMDLDANIGITKDGSNLVSNWADQSGHGNGAIQASGSAQPLWQASVFGSRPALRFDGVSSYMDLPTVFNVGPLTNWTIFAVVQRTAEPADIEEFILVDGLGSGDFMAGMQSATYNQTKRWNAYGAQFGVEENTAADTVDSNVGTSAIIACRYQAGVMTFWRNGLLIATQAMSANLLSAITADGPWCIGADAANFRFYANVLLGRLQVYQGSLDNTQITSQFNQLNSVYGIY